MVDFQIEQGIDGLCTTGESSTMTDEEDIEVVTILHDGQGRVPVIGGVTVESLRKAEALEKAGVDGLR